MTSIINAFLNATTIQEVDRIVSDNLYKVQDIQKLMKFARGAKRRITCIERAKKKYWADLIN